MLEGFSCAAAGGVSFSTEGFSVAVTGACANVTLLLDVPYWGPSVGRLSSRLLRHVARTRRCVSHCFWHVCLLGGLAVSRLLGGLLFGIGIQVRFGM